MVITMNIADFTVGTEVIRIAPDNKKTTFEITSPKVAKYLHDLQEHDYTYTKPVRVSVSDNVCVACEG